MLPEDTGNLMWDRTDVWQVWSILKDGSEVPSDETHLGELSELQDVSVSEAVDDLLSLSGHVLVLLAQSSQFGECADRPATHRLTAELVYKTFILITFHLQAETCAAHVALLDAALSADKMSGVFTVSSAATW